MNLGVAGRVAIVTGSARGIGRATGELFADEGAKVAFTFRHNRAGAEAAACGIRQRGGEALAVPLDLADVVSIRSAVDTVLERWTRIDLLVNNAVDWVRASEQRPALFEDVPPVEWRLPLRTNVEGVFTLTQAVVPAMRRAGWGRIVNVSSVAASDGLVGIAWYAAAKSALHGLTRTLARELGPAGILVNAVMPGATRTESVLEQIPLDVLERQGRRLPLGRVPHAAEVAAAIAFLASDANRVITGEIIRASGGRG